jgi:hypothetical protein
VSKTLKTPEGYKWKLERYGRCIYPSTFSTSTTSIKQETYQPARIEIPRLEKIPKKKKKKAEPASPLKTRNIHETIAEGHNHHKGHQTRWDTPGEEVADLEVALTGLWDFGHDGS